MLVYLIRHGKADYKNLQKKDNCSLANLVPLSEKGIEQAKSLQPYIKQLSNAKIISSPYTRTLQTAYIASERTDIVIEYDLHEWLPDDRFAINVEKISERNQYFKNHTQNVNYETKKEMQKRFSSIIEKYKNEETLIIFSHARVISTFLESIGAEDIYLKNCQIAEIEYNDMFNLKRIF